MENIDTPEVKRGGLVIIVLCGLIGSGKSTFSGALQREFPEFRRCNQDELGRRADVEREVHASLSRGLSASVDRTNIDPGQRRTWIELARQYPNVEIWGLEMDTPYDVCRARLTQRIDHPTIKTPEAALQILSRFRAGFIPIDATEGFNRVFRLPPHHSIDYDRQDLENILANIRASPYFESPRLLPPPSAPTRGRGSYPVHGHDRGYVYGDRGFQSHGWRFNQPAWGPNPATSSWEPRAAPRPAFDGNWRTREPASTNDRGWGFRTFEPRGYRGRDGGYGAYHRQGTPDRGARVPSVSDSNRDESGSAQNTGDRREEFEF